MEKSSPAHTPEGDGRASLWLECPLTAVSKRSTRRRSDWRLLPTRSGMSTSSRSGGAVTGRGRLREITWPGTPTTTELGGTALTTTAFAPIRLSWPIVIGPRIFAPAPIVTRSPSVG